MTEESNSLSVSSVPLCFKISVCHSSLDRGQKTEFVRASSNSCTGLTKNDETHLSKN
jgi:hypothetical protein